MGPSHTTHHQRVNDRPQPTGFYLHPDTGLHAIYYGHNTQALEDAIYAARLKQLQALVKRRLDEAIDQEDQ